VPLVRRDRRHGGLMVCAGLPHSRPQCGQHLARRDSSEPSIPTCRSCDATAAAAACRFCLRRLCAGRSKRGQQSATVRPVRSDRKEQTFFPGLTSLHDSFHYWIHGNGKNNTVQTCYPPRQ
jgi:hypothetical protein